MATLVTPTPQTWTLRLKSHKTTIFLHVNPLNTFTTIKSILFAALEQTTISSTSGNPLTLPESPSEIQLGRPINITDPSAGFRLGEWEYPADGEDNDVKGKGKAKTNGRPRKEEDGELAGTANIKDCPKGAGLKDNAVLAFRWRGDGTGWEDIEDDDIDMDDDDNNHTWGVKIPTYEDQYGVENAGDVGGRREFDE